MGANYKKHLMHAGIEVAHRLRWAHIAEENLEEILSDHAYCEQKAASTAISLMITYPEYSNLVTEMAALAREEMSHFEMVHQRILDRGFVLGRERKDEYVGRISRFFKKTLRPGSAIDPQNPDRGSH